MHTVASLIPSGTDIVAALGLGEHLVGVSHECDHPAAAGRPVLTRTTIATAGVAGGADPGEVDQQVSRALQAGESLYVTDRALLARLAPDVVVSQDVCDVCAVDGPTARAALPPGARLVMLTATTLAGLDEDVRRVGAALGAPRRADELVARTHARLDAVARSVAGRPRVTVVTVEWGDPPFLGGHWVPELVELAGGENLLSQPGVASARSTWAAIAGADPDVLVFMPCGYDLPAATAEARRLLERPEVAALRAVRDGRVWATDATRLFSRCTPVVAEAAEVLAAVLHDAEEPAGACRVVPQEAAGSRV